MNGKGINLRRDIREVKRDIVNMLGIRMSSKDIGNILNAHYRLCWHTEQYHNNPTYNKESEKNIEDSTRQLKTLEDLAMKNHCRFSLGEDGFSNYLLHGEKAYFLPIATKPPVTNEEKRSKLLRARMCLKDEYRRLFSYRHMQYDLDNNRLYSDDRKMYLEVSEETGMHYLVKIQEGN